MNPVISVMLAAAMTLTLPARAEEPAESPLILGAHRFVLPSTLDDPFPLSSLTFRQGVTYSRSPEVYASGYDAPFELSLLGASESLSFSARLSERLGLFGEAQGQVLTGLNADSAFFVGGKAGLIWEVGGVGVLLRSPERGSQLGLRLKARGIRGLVVEPEGLVQALLDDRESTAQSILEGDLSQHLLANERGTSGGLSLCYAQSIGPVLGVLTSAQFRAGRITRTSFDGAAEQEVRHLRLTGAGGVAADINPPASTAFQVEIRYRGDVEGGEELPEDYLAGRWFLTSGAYYDGRPDLRLGLVVGALLGLGPEHSEQSYTAELLGRYFF